ncbi:MAG TPA: ATP-binding protein [Bryobacteraceae bacterium]|nr:ATP-binding protein [Bryobacteraceae bacterium]
MTKAGQSRALANNEGGGRRRLLEISRRLSATIGMEFFQAIARHLAEALAADCVIVAEFIGGQMERCRSVGAWCDGAPARFEFELAGSAACQIALGTSCQFRSHARRRFPSDTLLAQLGAEACVGVPLSKSRTHTVGALLALYRRPVTSLRFPREMLDIFADRASAELVRYLEEEKLRESDQRYRAFIAKNADAMWRIEFEQPIPTSLSEEEQVERILKSGYMAECNDATARLLGMNGPDQLIGARVQELVPADPATRQAALAAVRAGYRMTTVETNRIDPNGRRMVYLRSQWGIVEDGHLQRIWGAHRDITDLRHAEMALDAAEQRMADLVESMRLLVVFLDLEGRIEFCNNYVFEITGWPADDLIGKEWLKTLIPVSERQRVGVQFDRNTPDRPVHFESGLLAKNGSLQIEWDSTVLRSSDGVPAARAIVGRDVTEQKGLQEQVLLAQKLAGIGRLAGGLAHDFNNLLTVILGYTAKLLDEVKPSDPSFASLTQIHKAAERSAELAHRLLTFSRREIFRPLVVDANTLVEETRSLLEALAGDDIRLILSLQRDLRAVRLDPSQFHQLLMNLVANARDAMPGGGVLTIATADFDIAADEPHPAGIEPGEYVLLTIADTGTGMTEEVKSHLFEPFFTTKEKGKGTGLGLAMVYGIVQQSSAHIRIDSEPGRGTTVRIFLPRVLPVEAPRPAKPKGALPRGTETVLLVEEPKSVAGTAATVLSELGYTVLRADGPLDAIDISGRQPNGIQLLVSGVVTHGMAGDVLLSMLKASQPNLRVLFVTNGADRPAMAENAPSSAVDFLPRRFSRKALAFKVREVLDRH